MNETDRLATLVAARLDKLIDNEMVEGEFEGIHDRHILNGCVLWCLIFCRGNHHAMNFLAHMLRNTADNIENHYLQETFDLQKAVSFYSDQSDSWIKHFIDEYEKSN